MMSSEEKMELVQRYLDGQADADDVHELEELMLEEPQLRSDFLRYARIDASIPKAIGDKADLNLIDASPVKVAVANQWMSMAAVLVMGCMLIAYLWISGSGENRSEVVATFSALNDCRWTHATTEIQAGDEIEIGQRIELSSGSAELLFSTGATLALHAPAILEIRSEKHGYLTMGEVQVTANTPESKGFIIETPTTKFVDISTAFLASVAPDGLSGLSVSEGEVDVILSHGAAPRRFGVGQSLYIEPGEHKILTQIESGDGTADFNFPSIEAPSDQDYADAKYGAASVQVLKGELNKYSKAQYLLDGHGQTRQDAPNESVFFKSHEQAIFLIDLGKEISIEKINSYSWHQNLRLEEHRERARQQFTLYGYAGNEVPDCHDHPVQHGWTRIARVNSDQFFKVHDALDRPAQQASSITAEKGPVGSYRYLLWVGIGSTFFGELDVYEAKQL